MYSWPSYSTEANLMNLRSREVSLTALVKSSSLGCQNKIVVSFYTFFIIIVKLIQKSVTSYSLLSIGLCDRKKVSCEKRKSRQKIKMNVLLVLSFIYKINFLHQFVNFVNLLYSSDTTVLLRLLQPFNHRGYVVDKITVKKVVT